MSALEAMQSAAIRLIGRRPNVFFGSPDTFEQQMCDLLNEAAQDIAEYQDWQALIRIANLVGDGVSTELPFPTDYNRQLVKSDLQDPNNWVWGYWRVIDINEFLFFKDRGWPAIYPGIWTIYTDKFQFFPPPANGQIAQFPYITNNIVKDVNGNPKKRFTDDSDCFVLNERLLTLWLVWRWRENNKLDFLGDQEAFQKAIDEEGDRDRGSRLIRRRLFGRWGDQQIYYGVLGGTSGSLPSGTYLVDDDGNFLQGD